ncbi:MAG: SPFH domain-containing protein [Chloroflexota bacterium]
MTEQDPIQTDQPIRNNRREQARTKAAEVEEVINDMNASVALLRTEADRARGVFGFGRRILVPPDEIHVVVGDGRHNLGLSNDRKVFGQTADRPSRYWLNSLTQVIKLKTISFTVTIHGTANEGVEALDKSKVSFRLWAHAVAKLNPEKADVAAQRVGLDTTGLVHTITKVGTAELVAAAATMSLEEIIASRQQLAAIAFPKVNSILSELGYDLALLTITRLGGSAYQRLIAQAEARISKETGIATNKEQLAELKDTQAREQLEAEIRAQTEKKLASERLDAQQEVETATLSQKEALAIRQHELEVKEFSRNKQAAEAEHESDLAKVKLAEQLGKAEAEKNAELAQLERMRQAELRAQEQKRTAEIKLAETQTEAARLAVEQAKQIERAAAHTEAEAARLKEEELARAERQKEIALVEASQVAEQLKLEAEAEARSMQIKVDAETKSMQIKVDAETKMELVKAEAEATATEKRAQAAKKRAEATKAETAAGGLAEAEVEAARVKVSQQKVDVTRAEGLALAEVEMAQAEAAAEKTRRLKEVEINAQKELALLYEQAPVLIELEKLRMQLAHDEKLAEIQSEAQLRAFEAIAPGVKINIFGNGGQTGEVMSNLMSISHGLTMVGDQVPAIGNIINHKNGGSLSLPTFQKFTPFIKQLMDEMNPRVFSSLKVTDVVDKLGTVVAGQDDLVTALDNIRKDASFRMVGDMPIGPILKMLGLGSGGDDTAVEEITVGTD